MKTLIGILIALSGGAAVGAVAVVGVQAIADPDNGVVEQSEQIDVLDYGTRG